MKKFFLALCSSMPRPSSTKSPSLLYTVYHYKQSQVVAKLLGALKKFVKCGIVTAEILEQFSSHYVPKLFMKEQLILLLKHLRIMAEVGKGEYLMPCLLRKQDIPRFVADASSLIITALLFYFGRDGPKLGVYCLLLASLITEAKWELLEEDNYSNRYSSAFVMPFVSQ